MITITICNKKGGVGKTTTAYTLAAMLHLRNFRVLAIDLDGQCNLTKMTGIKKDCPTIYSVMTREVPIGKSIIPTEWFDLIQGSRSLFTIGQVLTEGVGRAMRLGEALRTIRRGYDFCILDTPPAVDVVTANALMAADYVVIPAEANELSTDGIVSISDSVKEVREYYNSNLKIAGILLTRYRGRTNIAQDYKEIFQKYAEMIGTKLFSTEIRETIAFSEVPSVHQPIFAYRKDSSGTEDYASFTNELLTTIEENEEAMAEIKRAELRIEEEKLRAKEKVDV